jgi:N-acyl-D-aspartate/D-glutamate deacylase
VTEIYDLVVRGGTIADGSGNEPFTGDVAIKGDRIAAVGVVEGRGTEEIDAAGLLVTPGFVDIHTHYDGQVTWEETLTPSSGHGVSTVVMGNCGIGFAPCRPGDREQLVHLMEGVEDLPEPVLTAGLPWRWESFPDYLDFLEGRQFDIDVAAQVPHAALRVYTMGERAVRREPATAEDRKLMAQLTKEAMDAGAIGFATSRTINRRSSDGTHIPTLEAGEEELASIAEAVGASGHGVLQLVSDLDDVESELAMIRRIVERSGRPLSLSLMQWHHSPEKWRTVLRWLESCRADGLPIKGQVSGRPVGMLLGFEMGMNPFSFTPSFKRLANLGPEERRRALADAATRAAIISETPDPSDHVAASYIRGFSDMYALGASPDYEPDVDDSMAARAARRGTTPEAEAYDAMLEQNGQGVLMLPSVNFAYGNLEPSREMLSHADTVYGLGDGGAHLGFLCDASLPTFMLQYWVRDRQKGPRLGLAEVVRGLTSDPASAVGLSDRGRIAPGLKADLNIIDFDRLKLLSPRVSHDLPAGGRRVTQDAEGYVATLVSGVMIRQNDRPTNARPGKLVRGSARRLSQGASS